MDSAAARQQVIIELYSLYTTNGFITEDEALACFASHSIPLNYIDSLTEHLLTLGVIIKIDDCVDDDDDDIYDRTRTDYDRIFAALLNLSPELKPLVEYIKNIKPPQHREWQILVPQAQNGNIYAQDRLFDMYLRVVIKIALKASNDSGFEVDDTIQVGAMGLLKAINAYDSTKHGSFVSYMPLWISQYISRAISDFRRTIRIPVHMLETMRIVEQAIKVLQNGSDAEPTIKEIALACDMTEESIKEMQRHFEDVMSIEEFVTIDIDGCCSYDIEELELLSLESVVEQNSLREAINDILSTLKDRESRVLRLRFGIDNNTPKTLEEIGAVYGLTRERIRQIEVKAIKKLQHPTRRIKLEGYS